MQSTAYACAVLVRAQSTAPVRQQTAGASSGHWPRVRIRDACPAGCAV